MNPLFSLLVPFVFLAVNLPANQFYDELEEVIVESNWATQQFCFAEDTFQVDLPTEAMEMKLPGILSVVSMTEERVFIVTATDHLEAISKEYCSDSMQKLGYHVQQVKEKEGRVYMVCTGDGDNELGWTGYIYIQFLVSDHNLYILTTLEQEKEPSRECIQFFHSFFVL